MVDQSMHGEFNLFYYCSMPLHAIAASEGSVPEFFQTPGEHASERHARLALCQCNCRLLQKDRPSTRCAGPCGPHQL